MKSEFYLLIKEIKLHDHVLVFVYFHMSPTKYEHILAIVAPRYRSIKHHLIISFYG